MTADMKDSIVKRYRRWPLSVFAAIALLASFGCTPAQQAASVSGALPTAAPRTSVPLTSPTAQPTAYPAPASEQYPAPASEQYPAPNQAPPAPTYSYRVVASYPHDPGAFTQGLVYIGEDRFYEGTGQYGASVLREFVLATGEDTRPRVALDAEYFGEGIAVVGQHIFQITWQNGVGFIYDRESFERVGEFRYPPAGAALPGEGWGLAYDGQRLIMSDGSANLYFVDPAATLESGELAIIGQVAVQDAGQPIARLNELEYIDGEVWANIWTTDRIARIDPTSGQVTAWVDLSGLSALLTPADGRIDVLNGIAYDAEQGRLFVTGKWWPNLFEIELAEPLSLYVPFASAS